MAPAHRLDVPLLARELHPLLDQATSLLELAQARENAPLERVAERVGAADGDARPHRRIAVRQLDRPIEHRHGLPILADAEEGVRAGGNCDHQQRRVAGLLGESGRLAGELSGLGQVAVADAP